MKKLSLLGLILSLSPVAVQAEPATNSALLRISAAEADKYFDQTVVVTGKVVQVTIRPKVVFLNIDKPHPDSPFTAVIFNKDTNGFDLTSLEGKSVEITGKIKDFKDAPEIVIASTNQLTIATNIPAATEK